jgi:hypothetical protein
MQVSGWAESEFAGAKLCDARFRANLAGCAEALSVRGEASFTGAMTHAQRQAMGRFTHREKQTVEGALAGHVQETERRGTAWPFVVVAQDMTAANFSSQASRTDLGPHNGGADEHFLLIHSQLVVSPTGVPLGVVGMEMWTRDPATVGQAAQRRRRPAEEKESRRWRRGVERAEKALAKLPRILVVGDAEGDVYDHLAMPRRAGTDLLVRAAQDRVVWVRGQRRKLFGVAAGAPVVGRLTVTVPRQAGKPEREAELTVRETWVELPPPRSGRQGGLRYRLIQAAEESPPEAVAEPVKWVLLTTLGASQEPSASEVVRLYTRRWVIERWHYTLKSGQQLEGLQVEGLEPLKKAVAVLGVVAWQVLYVTLLAREEPERPAAEVLSPDELGVLRAAAPKVVETAADVVKEIARLAGYQPYRTAPPPGVKRVWRGLLRLHQMVVGWRLAREGGGEMRYEA